MNKTIKRKDNVFYPVGGIANNYKKITDLFKQRINRNERINIIISSQINSFPHVGTLINFMSAFALAKRIEEEFSKPVEITFDALDNIEGDSYIEGSSKYFTTVRNSLIDGISKYSKFIPSYKDILSRLSSFSGIPYTIRDYSDYQKLPEVRDCMIRILNNKENLVEILNPDDGFLHIRTFCPVCGYSEKSGKNHKYFKYDESYKILNHCNKHGDFETLLSKENQDFIDFNTQLRDILKGCYILEKERSERNLGIMVDGGDWGGLWAYKVHASSLMSLGYTELTPRIFSPTITDWSATKLSKRLYVGNEAFKELQEGLINYSKFNEVYGNEGFYALWQEVNDWTKDTSKFFRDYSVDYIDLVLNAYKI